MNDVVLLGGFTMEVLVGEWWLAHYPQEPNGRKQEGKREGKREGPKHSSLAGPTNPPPRSSLWQRVFGGMCSWDLFIETTTAWALGVATVRLRKNGERGCGVLLCCCGATRAQGFLGFDDRAELLRDGGSGRSILQLGR